MSSTFDFSLTGSAIMIARLRSNRRSTLKSFWYHAILRICSLYAMPTLRLHWLRAENNDSDHADVSAPFPRRQPIELLGPVDHLRISNDGLRPVCAVDPTACSPRGSLRSGQQHRSLRYECLIARESRECGCCEGEQSVWSFLDCHAPSGCNSSQPRTQPAVSHCREVGYWKPQVIVRCATPGTWKQECYSAVRPAHRALTTTTPIFEPAPGDSRASFGTSPCVPIARVVPFVQPGPLDSLRNPPSTGSRHAISIFKACQHRQCMTERHKSREHGEFTPRLLSPTSRPSGE